MGDCFFNMRDSKNNVIRPVVEWVKTSIPAIIDAATFQLVRIKRESRAPLKTPPRRVTCPTLLTGLLKCGVCGHAMTLVTGKGGKYRYYKCASRHNQGNHACTSGNLPMEILDDLVLEQLADKVLAPDRLQEMMMELRKTIHASQNGQQVRINELNARSRSSMSASSACWMPSRGGS